MSQAAVATWTFARLKAIWITPDEVRCAGVHHDQPCRKLLAKGLKGEVTIKCGRCGHTATYRQKGVDKDRP